MADQNVSEIQSKLAEVQLAEKSPEEVVNEMEYQKVMSLPDNTKYPGDELNYMELLERARTIVETASNPGAWPSITTSPDNPKFFRVINRCKGRVVHIPPPKGDQKKAPGIEPGTYAVFSAIFREPQFLYSKSFLFLDTEENLADNIDIAPNDDYKKSFKEGEEVITPTLEPHKLISDSDTTRLVIDKMDVKWIFENKQLSAIDICADALSSDQRKVKWLDMLTHIKWLKLFAAANKMNEEWISPKVAEVLTRNKTAEPKSQQK
jgi:hypothetical protein